MRIAYGHRCILTARSFFFRELFRKNQLLRRNTVGPYVVSGISMPSFLLLMKFLYTGNVSITESNVKELYLISRAVGAKKMYLSCQFFLKNNHIPFPEKVNFRRYRPHHFMENEKILLSPIVLKKKQELMEEAERKASGQREEVIKRKESVFELTFLNPDADHDDDEENLVITKSQFLTKSLDMSHLGSSTGKDMKVADFFGTQKEKIENNMSPSDTTEMRSQTFSRMFGRRKGSYLRHNPPKSPKKSKPNPFEP